MAQFKHRILTSWINDINSKPSMGQRWPIVDFNDNLIDDYHRLIDFAKQWGYNGIVCWGLFVNHNWPINFNDCLDADRKRRIHAVLDYAKKQGVDIYAGIGIFSWGFEEIIKANPQLMQGETIKSWGNIVPHNGDVMCFSQPESRQWQRKMIDFIVEQTDAPAFQLQPFDKGRCMCKDCSKMSDDVYFSRLNCDVAQYIKERWPDKKVAVSGWGMYYNRSADNEAVSEMAQCVDYISDVTDSALNTGKDFRKELIKALPCSFGNAAGGSVICPQTWDRLRWYLPHIHFNGSAIASLREDGGTACEVFAGPIANPSTRISLMALGAMLSNDRLSEVQAATMAAEEMYRPTDKETATEICELVLEAERAYFDRLAPDRTDAGVLFEAMDAVYPSKPIYLCGRDRGLLEQYSQQLLSILQRWQELESRIEDKSAFADTVTAISSVRTEIGEVLRGFWD